MNLSWGLLHAGLQTVLDTALDAVVVMGEDGRVIGWNAKAEQSFGWSEDDAVGARLSELLIPEQYRAAHETGLAHYLATGEGPVLNQIIEITARHRDGHEVPVELSITASTQFGDRMFIVGPNASGKSNFLDVFRFLHDLVKPAGGLQSAIFDRGGLSKMRCLAARSEPNVEIEVELKADLNSKTTDWRYAIGIRQEVHRKHEPYLIRERVWRNDELILDRPDSHDKRDKLRQSQTHLEQINANKKFREIAVYFESILYLHLVPQLLRHPKSFSGPDMPGDPFGRGFLNRVAKTPKKTKDSRLKKIETALICAVPQLEQLHDVTDEAGVPHLEAVYKHWRLQGAKQREDQFSDGTLRLIGLFWSLLEGDSLLLLEEPELSLNAAIVSKLPALIHRLQRFKRRQVFITTHSAEMLFDKSVGGESILLLKPGMEGTEAEIASSNAQIRSLLEGGMSAADAILPFTAPKDLEQLMLPFGK